MPKEWSILLHEAGITKQDQQAHPQAVLDIIGFYSDTQGGTRMGDDVWKKFNNTYTTQQKNASTSTSNNQQRSTPPMGKESKERTTRQSPETSPKQPNRHHTDNNSMTSNDESMKRRPPVPARPAHTLSIYSTDIQPTDLGPSPPVKPLRKCRNERMK